MFRSVFVFAVCLTGLPAHATDKPAAEVREYLTQYRLAQAFDCRDVSCKQLRSCEEACYKLLQCGQTKRDGDNDGIPCENLCKRRC
ncbi:excalibur calcium-binding domain-containing protein [Thalassococcus sp. CAU 1522]|uniref:Excalibur calcium-binding domain-containing protein n=1 Tax=Thalassococcus arenae TaxID=2851652 RepID=A0ABS6N9Z5_9RHOB|nr:excalibur calcium-binding domain-containing protein [Thalassococcus arenae]MBV2360814.1 excalibur calcium-binding domain-containing protein [Thalassococcus arenae]